VTRLEEVISRLPGFDKEIRGLLSNHPLSAKHHSLVDIFVLTKVLFEN